MKPRLTSWVLSEQRAGASSVTEHQDPIWTRRGRQPGAGQGVDPGVAREEARGHMSANLLVFFWEVVFFSEAGSATSALFRRLKDCVVFFFFPACFFLQSPASFEKLTLSVFPQRSSPSCQ